MIKIIFLYCRDLHQIFLNRGKTGNYYTINGKYKKINKNHVNDLIKL
jgi:hypothetical protein